jgi:hypothetical protein
MLGSNLEEAMKTKLVAACLLLPPVVVLSAVWAPLVWAQSAPGANPELALLSADLQNGRNSALSIHAQAEEKRKLKALAAKEAEAAAPEQADEPADAASEFAVTIPTGSGLVPARGAGIVATAQRRLGSIETAGGQRTDN